MKNINGKGEWGKGCRLIASNHMIYYPSTIQKITIGSLDKKQSALFKLPL